MADRTVTVRLNAEISKYKSAMSEASAASKKASEDAAKSWQSTAEEQTRAWESVEKAITLGAAAVGAGLGVIAKKYADFDAAMSNVQAATHASQKDMEKLRDAAVKAGADTKYSGEEAAQGIEELAKAGVSTKDILNGGLTGALSLAAAGQLEVGDAAELAATAMTQFKLSGDQVGHVADLLAAGAGKAQGSVGDLGYALKQSGLVASQAGLSVEETTGALAAFASAGLIGSDAGTSFKVMMQKLQSPTKASRALMQELGITMYDAQGNFIGLANMAESLKRGMQDMTPAQRDAAMATIFGSDAVRAAAVLYNQGGQGIQEWINKVNDSGYAAETAAMKQDNLKGDLEKLGGAIDTVVLQSGSGLNDFLRGLVQFGESAVDAFGKIPAPVLQAGVAITGLVAGGTLLVGAGLKVKAAVDTAREAIGLLGDMSDDSKTKVKGLAGTLSKVGGIAAVVYAGISTLGDVFEKQSISVDALNRALDDTGGSISQLDTEFAKADWVSTSFWSGGVEGVNGIGDAVEKLAKGDSWAELNGQVGKFFGYDTSWEKMRGDISSVDEALAAMVDSGNLDGAGKNFEKIAQQALEAGASAEDLTKIFPELENSILNYADALGVTLTPQETLDAMMGKMPDKLKEAAKASEYNASALDENAAAAAALAETVEEETIPSFKDLMDELRGSTDGLVDHQKALGDYLESLGGMSDIFDDVAEGTVQMSDVMDYATGQFNLNSEAGRKASKAYGEIATSTWDLIESMAATGAGYEDFNAQLVESYNNLVDQGIQLGLTAEQASALASEILGIPTDVNVETWLSDTAQRLAESTKQAVEDIPDSKTTKMEVEGSATFLPKEIATNIADIPNSVAIGAYMSTAALQTANATTKSINNLDGRQSYSNHTHTNRTVNIVETVRKVVAAGVALGMSGRASGGLVGSGAGANIRGYASGGLIPGTPPVNSRLDNLPGVVVDTGEPIRVRSREFIVNEKATRENLSLLRHINNGGKVRGFASGGQPGFSSAPTGVAVDTGLLATAVASALSGWAPMVSIDGKTIYGSMVSYQRANGR